MAEYEAKFPGGGTMVCLKVGDMSLSKGLVTTMMASPDLERQMSNIRDLKTRSDDVITTAFPKCGSHWVWEIVSMLVRQSANYNTNGKESANVEFMTSQDLEAMPSPRVLNTHVTPMFLPRLEKDHPYRLILILRNPKDVLVSGYHHAKSMTGVLKLDVPLTFNDFLHAFNLDKPIFGPCSYFHFIRAYENFLQDNPDFPCLKVFYEDMKFTPETEIQKIAEFLGVDCDRKLIEEISRKCSFERMKNENSDCRDEYSKALLERDGNSILYRKGMVGDWKNHFTVADNEWFDSLIKSELKESRIVFKYD